MAKDVEECMVDLETFGIGSNAVMIAIGAVKFNTFTKQITNRFYTRVDPQSCLDAGLSVSGSTLLWWLQQSEEARAQYKGSLPSLKIALDGFTAWMKTTPYKLRVWGNGATFDNVILTNAYAALKMDRPWGYTDDRCYRTLKALYPEVAKPSSENFTAHRADHDAEYQAIHLMSIMEKMRPAVAQAA